MTRSPAALLILALLIVKEVSSAPREERIPQNSSQEKFLETREDEVLERRSMQNGKSGVSREDEMRRRPVRAPVGKEPLASSAESKIASESKSAGTDKIGEAKDMTESVATPKDDDSTKLNKTSVAKDSTEKPPVAETSEKKNSTIDATNNNTNKSPEIKTSENKNSTDNSTDSNNKNPSTGKESETTNSSSNKSDTHLPPKESDKDTDKSLKNETDEEFKKKNHYTSDVQTPNASANITDNSVQISVDVVRMPVPNISNTVSTTGTPATVVTTVISPNPTNQEPTTIPTSMTTTTTTTTTIKPVTTTIKPVTTTETKGNGEEVTESTTTSVSPEPSKAELKLHEKKRAPMPSGIVALITAITFAMVAVMAYVGLIARRRYLEWRYGNRELLVNDFDANDIGNFEL